MSQTVGPEDHVGTVKLRGSGTDAADVRSRKRELLAEQRAHWESDRPAPAEDYLERWPTDPNSDPDAASLIIAEYFRRRDRGEKPELREYAERYSDRVPELANQILREELIRSLGGRRDDPDRLLALPEVGERLFGFRLRHPLGRGAFARVFVAEQPDLADRPVVLKVSANEGIEPQALARLQHTNIVPIYSVHEDARAGLRAVCMPYFGGASLSSVLETLWDRAECPTQGAQLVDALERAASPAPESFSRASGKTRPPEIATEGPREDDRPTLALLREMTYVRAVAWTVAQLADGLHHAHQRGILHRDIKPSNILLNAEGQPLLLDFNVAEDRADETAHAILGGTVAYASPEHLKALLMHTPESFDRVDQRSDVYSLGLVLAEMLAGRRLFEQGGSYSVVPTQLQAMYVERSRNSPSVKHLRTDVSWSLESITRTALNPDPAARYQQADHLGEDLRRFLEDRPLKYAPELSRIERVQKFCRRNPRLTACGSVLLASSLVIFGVGSALAGVRGHLAEARSRLGEAHAQDRKRVHDEGTMQALCLVNTTLGDDDHLRRGVAACEKALALYRSPEGRPFEQHPDLAWLAPAERLGLAEDRRELLLLLAGARVRLAGGDRTSLLGALALVDQAQALRGLDPSKALWLDRADYWARLGDEAKADQARRRAEQIRPSTARDHYLLASSYARRGGEDGYRRAIAELDEALRINPRHYWSAIQRGICRTELGEYDLAVGDFGIGTGLWPEHPWSYFNRAYVLDRLGRRDEAIADYTSALERDPGLVAARVNRGLALLERTRYGRALDDFDRALELGRDDAVVHAGRGMALEGLGRHDDADDAFRGAFDRVGTDDPAARARLCWTYGFAVSARLPDQARKAFDEVLLRDPRHAEALYGRAMLAMREGRDIEAMRFFDRALDASPGFLPARRYRAVLLAREGDWERAGRDINQCLEREPNSGASLYAAACVTALATRRTRSPELADQAIDLLRRAVARGAGRLAGDDPDLAAIRDDPRFVTLAAGFSEAQSDPKVRRPTQP